MFVHSSLKKNWYLLCIISLILGSCSNAKYAQCQQIIEIANQVSSQTQEIIDGSGGSKEAKVWSKAITIMNLAADKLDTLSLQDPKLAEYQNNLAEIFRLYSQATNDAIEARETKNLKALKSAVAEAQQAGVLKEQLVKGINSYCLGKSN